MHYHLNERTEEKVFSEQNSRLTAMMIFLHNLSVKQCNVKSKEKNYVFKPTNSY